MFTDQEALFGTILFFVPMIIFGICYFIMSRKRLKKRERELLLILERMVEQNASGSNSRANSAMMASFNDAAAEALLSPGPSSSSSTMTARTRRCTCPGHKTKSHCIALDLDEPPTYDDATLPPYESKWDLSKPENLPV